MKIIAFTATAFAAITLVGGSALAQVTMQPVPNPPEKTMSMSHMGKMKHHHKMHHMKAKMGKMAPAAATDTSATPMSK